METKFSSARTPQLAESAFSFFFLFLLVKIHTWSYISAYNKYHHHHHHHNTTTTKAYDWTTPPQKEFYHLLLGCPTSLWPLDLYSKILWDILFYNNSKHLTPSSNSKMSKLLWIIPLHKWLQRLCPDTYHGSFISIVSVFLLSAVLKAKFSHLFD
jgi:hypothetical protein